MAETERAQAGTVETTADFAKSPSEFTKHWLQAIDLAGEDEKDWRDDAKHTIDRYRKTRAKSFNVLYANTQTTCPALYNSEPVPDIRRRFGDTDPVGKAASQMLERALSIECELYDFDACMKAAVKDRQLGGRGVTRVRVNQADNGAKWIACEPVIWDDFRRGPAKVWADVPWQAFRHRMTREELVKLDPKVGREVKLDSTIDVAGKEHKGDNLPDMFKRAIVWEVWDKLERKVYFFAESFKDGPVKVITDDPYRLRDFFPVPKPLYQVELTDSLIPVCEFKIWEPLANEMDDLTARIAGIVAVMRLRGLYAGQFESLIKTLTDLNDGELAAAPDSARSMQEGGIDKAVWMWPVDMAIQVLEGLYKARMEAKASVYEMTGVADILRGQTDPNETLGAQQIKAQWGSLRLQEGQRDVQRYARDLLRMMADLSCQHLEFVALTAMTGVSFVPRLPPNAPPDQQQNALIEAQQMAAAVEKLIKGPDLQREFVIEIETDSTIRADLSRNQQNVSGFVTGLAEFMQGVAPAVQAGFMPPQIAVKYIGVFSRNFKLGREAENLTDEWVKWLEEQAGQPKEPTPEEKKAQADIQAKQMDMQMKQQEAQMKQADRAAEMQAKQQERAMDIEAKRAEIALKAEELRLRGEEIAMNAQAKQQEHAFRQQAMAEDAAFQQQNRAKDSEFEDKRRASELEHMRQRQAVKPTAGADA